MRKVSPSLERHIVNWTLPREFYPPTSRCFQLWQTRYTRHRIFSEHCFRGGGGEGAVERAISIFLLETLSSSFFLFPPPPPLYYPLYLPSTFERFSRCFPSRLSLHSTLLASLWVGWAFEVIFWGKSLAQDSYSYSRMLFPLREIDLERNIKSILTKLNFGTMYHRYVSLYWNGW